jgi:hypothetical protein
MEEVQRKGMSKGCLVSLIVAGVLLLIIIVVAVTCYVKRDELARFGAVSIVNDFKSKIIATPVQGVDTVKFDALADAFVQKVNSTKLSMEEVGKFLTKVQPAAADKTIDSADVAIVTAAIISTFPDLAPTEPESTGVDTTEAAPEPANK